VKRVAAETRDRRKVLALDDHVLELVVPERKEVALAIGKVRGEVARSLHGGHLALRIELRGLRDFVQVQELLAVAGSLRVVLGYERAVRMDGSEARQDEEHE